MEFKHVSVLLEETIDSLNICPDGIYVDGTTGGGGHSYEIAKRLGDKGRLICIDQDAEALTAARMRLASFEEKITFVKSAWHPLRCLSLLIMCLVLIWYFLSFLPRWHQPRHLRLP